MVRLSILLQETDRLNDENLRRLFVESNLEEAWMDEGGVTSQGGL